MDLDETTAARGHEATPGDRERSGDDTFELTLCHVLLRTAYRRRWPGPARRMVGSSASRAAMQSCAVTRRDDRAFADEISAEVAPGALALEPRSAPHPIASTGAADLRGWMSGSMAGNPVPPPEAPTWASRAQATATAATAATEMGHGWDFGREAEETAASREGDGWAIAHERGDSMPSRDVHGWDFGAEPVPLDPLDAPNDLPEFSTEDRRARDPRGYSEPASASGAGAPALDPGSHEPASRHDGPTAPSERAVRGSALLRRLHLGVWLLGACVLAAMPSAARAGEPASPGAGARPESRAYAGRHERFARPATPTFVDVSGAARPALPPLTEDRTAALYDQNRLLAGHLLRRIGFGPNAKDLKQLERKGYAAWIEKQLNPSKIDDSALEARLPRKPNKPDEDYDLIRRWYVRMTFSRRQLLEKMTLIWHEHFATSDEKVAHGLFMNDQEELLRSSALGRFRDLLIGITRDQAMLIWLDNDDNDGNAEEPPNENYAREFLQLFSTGTLKLNLDGTPELDADGSVQPAYTENDVREVARALTGWYVPYPYKSDNARFAAYQHDEGSKTIMGVTIPGRVGADGANEVGDVVDVILQQRQTTVAAFISRTLIYKLATETPTPQYVSDVASVFIASGGSIKDTVRAILLHPEFTDPVVVRTQFKEPIEQFVGTLRALDGYTNGDALIDWSYDAGQLVYYPPSVFSFYPPGNKGALQSTAFVFSRDQMADEFVNPGRDTGFNAAKLIKKKKFHTPDEVVDYLSDALLTAPLQDEARAQVLTYMNGVITEDTVRGATWLILCSPDAQRN